MSKLPAFTDDQKIACALLVDAVREFRKQCREGTVRIHGRDAKACHASLQKIVNAHDDYLMTLPMFKEMAKFTGGKGA